MASSETPTQDETLTLTPTEALASDSIRSYTYGQFAPTAVVPGKPTTHPVALEVLQPNSVQANMSMEEAEAVLKQWWDGKLGFLAWLAMTAVFGVFYGLFLRRLFLFLAAGVVLTVITNLMYFSPWFKSADGIFTVMTFLVATIVTDYICAFLSIVFGFNETVVLGCGALIFAHGTMTMYLFRKHKAVVAASEKLERAASADNDPQDAESPRL